jgi:hypothetical protein
VNKPSFSCHTNKNYLEVIMAKAGMRRPDPKQPHGTESNRKGNFPKNEAPPVPEMQGKVKTGKDRARPM